MIDFLLSASISCADGLAMIDRVKKHEFLIAQDKREIIHELKQVMDCDARQKKIN